MDLNDILAGVKRQLAAKLDQRKPLTEQLAAFRATPDTADPEKVDSTIAARAALDAEIDALLGRQHDLEDEIMRDAALDKLSREITPVTAGGQPERTGTPYDRVHRIGQEERTYRKDTDPTGRQFLRDVALAHLFPGGGSDSVQRIAKHAAESRVDHAAYMARATGTGAFAGLTVPQYLTEMYAPALAAMRPFADACNQHVLPSDGMTLNLSRITTASSAALQASENASVSETNMDDTLLTIAVQTAAGQQTMSRQAIERGTGTEDVTVSDLFKRYATVLDSTLVNQAVTGLSAVATANAYTDASPTAAEFYPKILEAASLAEANLLGVGTPDLAVMHSRRWYWMQSQMSSTWPLIQQSTLPLQMGGLADAMTRYGSGVRGVLPSGLAVIVDNNLATNLGAGTNEDEVYVVPSDECHLWEDPDAPVFIRAEQPAAASLGILLVVYGYFAYTFGRYPLGMRKIGGTGLVTPTF